MSQSVTMDEITLENLGCEAFEALEAYFDALGCRESDGDSGTITIHDVPVVYTYSPGTKQLAMTITEPSKAVTPDKIRSLLGRVRKRLGKVDDFGIYSYVTVTIANESDQVVIYSEKSVENGEVNIEAKRIEAGDEVKAFQARSSTGSTTGCKGVITYSFADGNTQLTMSYQLIGENVHTFNSGVKGTNARRFDAIDSNTEPHFECGEPWATEMNPTVTIKRVKP